MTVTYDRMALLYEIANNDFERISVNISSTWGTAECAKYLHTLTLNDHSRYNRSGFPKEVFTAIMRLEMLHDREFPQFANHDIHPWLDDLLTK